MKTVNLTLLVLAAAPHVLFSENARRETQWVQPAALSSGALANLSGQAQVKEAGTLEAPGAQRVRVVADAALGTASQIRFTSIADGQSQTLNAAQLAMWSNTSALFNGNRVRVELVLAPGDAGVSVRIPQVLAFSSEPAVSEDISQAAPDDPMPETLCGGDNRVASNDNRVGRIAGGCTGWLVSNGAVLTAGHCGIVAGSILEVNVPASAANGATVASVVRDQFPVLANTITTVNSGVGNDYTVCQVGANNLAQFAHQLHGFFRMTRELPAGGAIMRVTGCGLDNTPVGSQPNVCGNRDSAGNCTHFGLNAQSQTLQTSTGTFTGETGSGGVISLQYAVDTEPANSGSPIIWGANGFTIGIHTAGGCGGSSGSNNGTSFEVDALENAISRVAGANPRYLDQVKAPGGAEDGSIFQPYDTLGEAVNAMPVGGQLSVVAGSYSGAGTTLTKAMTITAPVGGVTLGN